MAHKQQIFLIHMAILILIIAQSCNAYSWFKDSDGM